MKNYYSYVKGTRMEKKILVSLYHGQRKDALIFIYLFKAIY